jgi:hypothetical protein
MLQQLLWLETLLKLSGGLFLLLFPLTVIKVLGLPPAGSRLWPRLLGAMLVALAAASFIEGAGLSTRGLGVAGSLAVNLAAAAVLAAHLMTGDGARTRRESVLLWSLTLILIVLVSFEIAFV